MKKRSKRYKNFKKLINQTSYSLNEGIHLIKDFKSSNFIESVDFFLNWAVVVITSISDKSKKIRYR